MKKKLIAQVNMVNGELTMTPTRERFPEEFLSRCTSENALYSQFKWLLSLFSLNKQEGLGFIEQLKLSQKTMGEGLFFDTYHFKFIQQFGFDLIVFKSVFVPENWSQNFYKGLSQVPLLSHKTACEIGCGCGLFSLYLAREKKAEKVYGLDINPHAVLNAKLNALINTVENAEFYESDLLNWVFTQEDALAFDLIAGCVPQIFSNSSWVQKENITFDARLDILEALSHFCGKRRNPWDKLGLGLNAEALWQSHSVLTEGGVVVLNLGGRLGPEILQEMFFKTGYRAKELHTVIFPQTNTDISALTELEKEGLFCEFFSDPSGKSENRISATDANQRLLKGIDVFHRVTVFQLTPLDDSLKGFHPVSLSPYLDYINVKGSDELRDALALMLRTQLGLNWKKENLFVSPSLSTTVKGLLRLYPPTQVLADFHTGFFPKSETVKWDMLDKQIACCDSIWMTALDASFDYLPNIFEQTAKAGKRVFIDITPLIFHEKKRSFLQKVFNGQPIPEHVTFLWMLQDSVYGMTLSVVVSENGDVLDHLSRLTELTYSRIPLLTEKHFLMRFPTLRNTTGLLEDRRPRKEKKGILPFFAEGFQDILFQPTMESARVIKKDTLELDFGVNQLPMPKPLKRWLAQTMLMENCPPVPIKSLLKSFLSSHFGIETEDGEIAHGLGVAPLVEAMFQRFAQERDFTVIFPSGTYREFVNAARLNGLQVVCLPTKEEDKFKLTPDGLRIILTSHPNSVLYLNAPYCNPTGQGYSSQEVERLMAVIHTHNKTGKGKARVLLDTIFWGLGFSSESFSLKGVMSPAVYLVGGVSKTFAVGGLRYGFLYTQDRQCAKSVNMECDMPDSRVVAAMARLYSDLQRKNSEIWDYVRLQQTVLLDRAVRLRNVLVDHRWKVMMPEGGLFLIAKPGKQLIGKKSENEIRSFILTENNAAEGVFEILNIRINSSEWTGLPGYCRFMLSVEEPVFKAALERLSML